MKEVVGKATGDSKLESEGKADQLNAYNAAGGGPDDFAEDLARYTSLSPAAVQAAVVRSLPPDRRVELIVEPEARQ